MLRNYPQRQQIDEEEMSKFTVWLFYATGAHPPSTECLVGQPQVQFVVVLSVMCSESNDKRSGDTSKVPIPTDPVLYRLRLATDSLLRISSSSFSTEERHAWELFTKIVDRPYPPGGEGGNTPFLSESR